MPVIDNPVVQGPVNVSLALSNLTGNATLFGSSTVPLTILNDNVGISFSSPIYVVNKTNTTVTLNVTRFNVTTGTTTVNYATADGSAVAGTNYVGASGTLTFNPGETLKTLSISILHDPLVTGNLSFNVNLSVPSGGAQLASPSSASVVEIDAEAGINFASSSASVMENSNSVVLAVVCSNPNVEPISVNYATADGTASAGVDYQATSGMLTFTGGQVTNYITVPIINNVQVGGNLMFSVNLFNPAAPGVVLTPSTETVTIINNNSGLSFSSPTYLVLKSGVAASIGVIRTGYTNSTVSVNYNTQDGSAVNVSDYQGVSGTLTFTNGQTSTNFSVPVIDSTFIKPDRTVLLQLSGPSPAGNSTLVAPSAATLTIHDNSGSLVVPAGSAMIYESFLPTNGIIDPGETVTNLFALRDSAGTNTANLTATLLSTNGISSPSGPQNYGALIVGGHSVSRPFSFTANGTNGQQIIATFQLQDNGANVGTASFTYTLGTSTASFSNNAVIVINDVSPATPYPSTINASGQGGALNKVTVALNKVSHTSPSDIDALLVSPSGQKMLLMANTGGGNAINNVMLSFDGAATASLPQTGQIVSGTYKPTAYFPVATFPVPAPPAPYATNLAAFSGGNPNGAWSLYVIDDSAGDVGVISNGWSLNFISGSPLTPAVDMEVTITNSPNPVIVGNNLTYTVTVTNYGPSSASDVTVTNTMPPGANYVSSAPTLGSALTNNNQVVWTVGALTNGAGAALVFTVQPTVAGFITSTSSVQSVESDLNPGNNSASVGTTVNSLTADLIASLTGTPSPLWLGNNLTYTISVTNAGPAAASNVAVTNTLPSSATLVSGSPNAYVVSGNVITFTNLGSLSVGSVTVAVIVVHPNVDGTITNLVLVGSSVPDPLKGNNTASVKTIVQSPQMSVSQSGVSLAIAWPSDAANYVLQSATSLNPPIAWTMMTDPSPSVVGGQKVVNVSIGSGNKYFRLYAP